MNEALQLSANRRLTLGGSSWRLLEVTSGCVEVFLVQRLGEAAGRRHHFASVPAGGIVFDAGFPGEAEDAVFIAIGQADTALRELAPPAGPLEPGELAALAASLDAWIESVVAGLATAGRVGPADAVGIAPGPVPALEAGAAVRAQGLRPVWWQSAEAPVLFLGDRPANGSCLPLPVNAWAACPEGAPESRALSSEQLLADGSWLERVAAANRLLTDTAREACSGRSRGELDTRERRSMLREAAAGRAWEEIAGVLNEPGGPEAPGAIPTPAGSLRFAFETVARLRGITARVPDLEEPGRGEVDAAQALARCARSSSIRLRRVSLEGGWFQRDHGPLIGFLEATGEAVALVRQHDAYHAQRPDGSWFEVGRPDAPSLHPAAFVLYRSLPDRALRLRDVIQFTAWGAREDVLMIAAMVVLTGLLGIVTPMLTARIFDLVIPQAERLIMAQIGVVLVTAALVRVMLELVRGMATLRLQNRADLNLQAAVWDRLLKMPARFFRRFTAGDLATRAQGVSQMHDTLSSAGTAVLFALPTGLFNFFVMFQKDVTLALWGLGLASVAVVVSVALNARQIMVLRQQYEVQGKLAGLVFQLINGVAKFRIAGSEDLAFGRWARDYARQERFAVEAGRWGVAAQTFFGGFGLFSSLVIFAVVARLAEAGSDFSTGSFLAFNAAYGALAGSLISVGNQSLTLLQLVPLLERTRPIFEATPEVAEDRASPGPLRGAIDLVNIRFRYADDLPPVLDGFSLRVEPGEFVALVGPSGSGKSTVLRLLLGFESPEGGTVFYDGKDLQTLDLGEVRRQIGVVMQNSRLVAGDIFRNIVGESSLTLDDAWRAAEMAGLAEDIRAMPMQMHTMVSEGGGGFSGGQKQRLAIARALAHAPRLLYFDEATSALDNRTQAVVTASLEKLHATRIVIAHRLSTITQADRIVVLREGRVVEDGTYSELMARRGFFHQLAARQLAESGDQG